MAYRIELAQRMGEPFHLEFDLRGQGGRSIPGGLTDVAFSFEACGCTEDYGSTVASQTEIASTAAGSIFTRDGVVVIDQPFTKLFGRAGAGRTLRYALVATRAGIRSLLANVLISFEGCC